jgi:hypothetical protein
VTGLYVPAAARVVPSQQVLQLAEAAETAGVGWDGDDLAVGDGDLCFLLPYSYEAKPMPLWKCRVIEFQGGLSVEPGQGKTVRFGRLDIPCNDFRRLSTASRKTERQILFILAGKAAAETWKKPAG